LRTICGQCPDKRGQSPDTVRGEASGERPHRDGQDRPHVCNDGWVTLGQPVVDPETGEETEEFALYLCRRCAGDK
jgi:hypothetical protein